MISDWDFTELIEWVDGEDNADDDNLDDDNTDGDTDGGDANE